MIIRNILFAGSMQYIILTIATALALAILLVRERKDKLKLFFFFLLSCAFYNFFLYFGVLFFLLAFAIFGFYLMLYLYFVQREKYYYTDLSSCVEEENGKKRKSGSFLRLVFPILFCAGIAVPFVLLSQDYFSLLGGPSAWVIVSFSSIATELYERFNIHFLIIITTIFMMSLWIIIMAENSKENK